MFGLLQVPRFALRRQFADYCGALVNAKLKSLKVRDWAEQDGHDILAPKISGGKEQYHVVKDFLDFTSSDDNLEIL
jgi:hypothetical protein